jgi:hypothetical protein
MGKQRRRMARSSPVPQIINVSLKRSEVSDGTMPIIKLGVLFVDLYRLWLIHVIRAI